MSDEIPTNTAKANNDSAAINRETGFYWVRIDDSWYLTKYYSHKDLIYFPGYFDGFAQKDLHEIDERRLDKKFDGYKRKNRNIEVQAKQKREDGYYWVQHDAMWFAAYYLSSKDEFFFPGQIYGFDPPQLEEIEDQQIERQ